MTEQQHAARRMNALARLSVQAAHSQQAAGIPGITLVNGNSVQKPIHLSLLWAVRFARQQLGQAFKGQVEIRLRSDFLRRFNGHL